MSVFNILDASNKILATYLPSGPAPINTYCENPMNENLVGGGYSINGVTTISCNTITLPMVPQQAIVPNSPAMPTYFATAGGSTIASLPVLTQDNFYTFSLPYSSAGNAIGNVSIKLVFTSPNSSVTVFQTTAANWNALGAAGDITTLNITLKAGAEACDIAFYDAGGNGAEVIIYDNIFFQTL